MLVGRVIDGWGWVNGEGRKETEKCVLVGSGRWGEEREAGVVEGVR